MHLAWQKQSLCDAHLARQQSVCDAQTSAHLARTCMVVSQEVAFEGEQKLRTTPHPP